MRPRSLPLAVLIRFIKEDHETMPRKLLLPALLCVVCWGFALNLLADEVNLKNGDRLSGTIVKSDGKTLTLKSEFAGVVNISWEAIDRVTASQPLYLSLNDGQTVVGTVAGGAEKYDIATKDAGNVAVAKSAIKTIRNQEEQTAYLAEIERFRNPRLVDLWAGSFDLGHSLTRGNADTNTFTLGANATRATTRDKISVYAAAIKANARSKNTGLKEETANAIRGGGRYEINLSSRTFAFGFSDLEFDEFQRLDLRAVLGGGLGYHTIKNENTLLDVFGGGSHNKEYFSTGLRRSSGEVLIGEELTHKLSARSLLKERLVFFPNMSDRGEYRLNFDTSLVTNLNRWLSWQVTLSDRYLSNPVPGAKSNDVLITTGIRLTFAK
jgi:putative salt-induced outer membrane protein YdiY